MNKDVALSKAVLEMKFMKKTKEKVLKDKEDAESKEIYSHEITEEMKKANNIIFREVSLTVCKQLMDGRLSFGGMNPKIEKLMENDYYKELGQTEAKKEKDITDEEMANQYSTVVDTVKKKFQTKKRKKNFQKPATDESLLPEGGN
ncbi:M-phase phosphoprotein 6 [Cylas formicarius]|uniref:M-phase phosphoprotein 6 n=1 Tax=Cylas formicarius TaxID=197179 RepID=UPI002958938D|nr:M-phase phosphoprotein 6 [Cylas formicarius]